MYLTVTMVRLVLVVKAKELHDKIPQLKYLYVSLIDKHKEIISMYID